MSGEPEFKHTPVMIQPFYTQWQGVLYVREGFEQQIQTMIKNTVWWSKIQTTQAIRYELADRRRFSDITGQIKSLLDFNDESFEWLNLEDRPARISPSVVLQRGHLIAGF